MKKITEKLSACSSEVWALAAFLLATLISMFIASNANAFERVNANTVRIKLLSYNVKGLPALINPDYDQDRFGDIGDILAAHKQAQLAPDVVVLQEAFSNRTPELAQHAGYPYLANGPSSSKPINSGLMILSDFPIAYDQTMLYGEFDCGTWDCFASKGAQMVRLQLPGVPFLLTIANTHAQSGDAWEVPRLTQLHDFAVFLASVVNHDLGLIAAGDFNSFPALESFTKFKSDTGMHNVGEICVDPRNGCVLGNTTNRQNVLDKSVDHVFIANGHRVTMRPVSVERTFTKPYKGRMLSDHFGYETVLEISWL